MKKKYLFLLTIPALCLFSCNKATKITYRDNYTKRIVYSGENLDDLVSSTTSTYDENGLPIEVIETNYISPIEASSILNEDEVETVKYTYKRAFDDKHREIRLEENVTVIDKTNNLGGRIKPSNTTTIVTREYDDSRLSVKEESKKLEYDDDFLTSTTTVTRFARKITNDSGYSVFVIQTSHIKSIYRDSNRVIVPNQTTMIVSMSSYDKKDRNTGFFNLSVTKANLSGNNATSNSSVAFTFTRTNYQSDKNDTNDFYGFSYQQTKSMVGEFITNGSETYSDKNLLIERQTESSRKYKYRYTDNQGLDRAAGSHRNSINETWQYDDFDRLILNESKETAYDMDDKEISSINSKADYSYANDNDQEPSKVTYHADAKDERGATTITDTTELAEFDDYGRVKTYSVDETIKGTDENKESYTRKRRERIVSDYADPIAIPKDEELILIPKSRPELY